MKQIHNYCLLFKGERLLCDTCKHKMNKRIETTRNKFIQKTGCLCSGTVSNGKFSGQGFVTTTCTSTGPANSVSSSSTKHQRSRTSITTRKHDKLQTSQDDVIFISSKKASSSVQHKRPLLPDTNHSISGNVDEWLVYEKPKQPIFDNDKHVNFSICRKIGTRKTTYCS